MPSKTFYNLDKAKQERLIQKAMNEFSIHKYQDVSINKIIANANISRGSFYMYFTDKEELFEYLIDLKMQSLDSEAKKIIKSVNGNLREFFIKLFYKLTENFDDTMNIGILKNVFMFNRLREKNLENPNHKLFLAVKDYIDTTNLKDYDLEFVFTFISHNLFFAIDEYAKTNDFERIKNKYLWKLDIIFYGIFKEEK